jgi:hypothetical protein
MPFSHDTGTYNVYGTLVAWLQEQLNTNRPPLVSSVRLNLDHPQQPIDPPEWSVHFRNDTSEITLQGKNPGEWNNGMMEVNCWVSRKTTNWRGQLNQMADAVTKAVAGTAAVIIQDFYTSSTAPTDLPNKIDMDRAEVRGHTPDPNPDIERTRIIIFFRWVERST